VSSPSLRVRGVTGRLQVLNPTIFLFQLLAPLEDYFIFFVLLRIKTI
jgi:hypothetical protein